ncbi:MAG TPA: SDR family oxidoreductase [Candidatus Binatia bacterium]|nr:SDR family oxidoreductase [Candidatus Binatia bacterium]
MLLANKNAVVYGAAGSIGSAVARAFAREGARLFLAGRTLEKLETVAREIVAAGGDAQPTQVEVLDEPAVDAHVRAIVEQAGRIDILFNAVGMEDVQGIALVDMSVGDFMQPIVKALKSEFITARAVGRRMVANGSGVIMTITAGPPEAIAYIGGFGAACQAVEGLWRGLAAELGPRGVRVVCIRSAGSPDTPDVQETFRLHAKAMGVPLDECLESFSSGTLLKRLPRVAEIANVAALIASDQASAITGAFISATCGSRTEL